MAKRDFIQRHLLIIKLLRKRASTFLEIQDYLLNQQDLTGYNFEISQRTFQRDKDEIASIWGIDINFNRKAGVYEITEEESDSSFERIVESFNIVSALQHSKTVSNYIFLEKRKPLGTDYFNELLQGIQDEMQITFQHNSYAGDVTLRNCVPKAIKESQNRWYLIAYDLDKKDFRSFGLERISDIQRVKKNTQTPYIDIEKHYKDVFGIETYETPQFIVLEFEKSQKAYIESLPIHTSQRILEEGEDTFCLELFLQPTYDFAMEVLRYGSSCEVKAPEYFREYLKEVVGDMSRKYGV